MDREAFQHLIHAIRKLARFIGWCSCSFFCKTLFFFVYCFTDADPTDVVFVQNATTGINAVIRSIVKTFQPGDSILLLDMVYG